MIRIAQQGRASFEPAKTLDDVVLGLGVWWVEIDGVRIPNVIDVTFHASEDTLSTPEMTVRVAEPIEIVYLDAEGNELGAADAPFPVDGVAHVDNKTIVPRP